MLPGFADAPFLTCAEEHKHARPICLRWVRPNKEDHVLSTLIVVLIVLWLLGVVTSYTLGGFIHILLVVAVIVFLLRVIQGRNPLAG